MCSAYNILTGTAFSFPISDKKIVPKGANDIKLINAGKILENSKTVGQCRVPFGELPRAVITMHVVVQPSLAKAKTGSFHSRLLVSPVFMDFYQMHYLQLCNVQCKRVLGLLKAMPNWPYFHRLELIFTLDN